MSWAFASLPVQSRSQAHAGTQAAASRNDAEIKLMLAAQVAALGNRAEAKQQAVEPLSKQQAASRLAY